MEIHNACGAAVAKELNNVMMTIKKMTPPLFKGSHMQDPFSSILFEEASSLIFRKEASSPIDWRFSN